MTEIRMAEIRVGNKMSSINKAGKVALRSNVGQELECVHSVTKEINKCS